MPSNVDFEALQCSTVVSWKYLKQSWIVCFTMESNLIVLDKFGEKAK